MSGAIAETEVRRQLAAMGCARVDLGALSQSGRMMLAENCSARLIPSALRWLRQENARGAHIFVRPAGADQLVFSLLDDLTRDAIVEMKRVGFEPAIVVETSPGNFQAWIRHARVLEDQRAASLAAKELARRFHGDLSAAGWRHFGRLAGFTNQKSKRRLPNGLQPFVKLREARGRTYTKADEFFMEITATLESERSYQAARKTAEPRNDSAYVKPLSAFHGDTRYGGDLHRADLAWAIYAASRGFSEQQIRDEILYARDLSKKGRASRQLEYAGRTALKAITIVQPTR
jgi:hypothetical protein